MKFIAILSLIILVSCNTKQTKEKVIDNTHKKIISKVNNSINEKTKEDSTDTEIIETFVDSLNIGVKGKCKIELKKHRINYDNYILIKFYVKGRNSIKENESWMIQNEYSYETNAIMEFQPSISDFNNDNFNDITFISGSAVRGSNEVRRLFIYDYNKKKLLSILNSEDYPNMLYNEELDCIDSFIVTGTTTTVFAKILGDSLKTFAYVHNDMDFNTIYLVNKEGIERELYKVKSEDIYIRHKNYKPLIEYKIKK